MGALRTFERSLPAAAGLGLLLSSCTGLGTRPAPELVGQATFSAERVTSGLSSVSTPPGTTVRFVDFTGTEEGGEARIEFRWKPYQGLPYVQSSARAPEGEGVWRMQAVTVYMENHQYRYRRHRATTGTLPIDPSGVTATVELADPVP